MACLFPLHRNYRDVPTQRVSGGGGQRNYRVNYYAGSTDPQFDDDLNKILEDYLHRNAGTNASVLMPIGGLRALNNLIKIANPCVGVASLTLSNLQVRGGVVDRCRVGLAVDELSVDVQLDRRLVIRGDHV